MFWIGALIGAMFGSAFTILVVCICMTGGDSDVERICLVSETDYNELYEEAQEKIAYQRAQISALESELAEDKMIIEQQANFIKKLIEKAGGK